MHYEVTEFLSNLFAILYWQPLYIKPIYINNSCQFRQLPDFIKSANGTAEYIGPVKNRKFEKTDFGKDGSRQKPKIRFYSLNLALTSKLTGFI